MSNAARFLESLKKRVVVVDGAMGTQLAEKGLKAGYPPERWNLERPDCIAEVHRDYIRAGCDAIITNSFGANALRMKTAGLGKSVNEINRIAAELAIEAAEGEVLVLGDIGPTGHSDKLPPFGDMKEEEFLAAFRGQAAALAKGGVHALYIETMSSVSEAVLAVKAARMETALPIICSLSFMKTSQEGSGAFRTLWGDTVTSVATQIPDAGADVLGANCGEIAMDMPALATAMAQQTSLPLAFEPNAGVPHLGHGGATEYNMDPDDFGKLIQALVSAGARMVGGCCGTTPRHLAAVRAALGPSA